MGGTLLALCTGEETPSDLPLHPPASTMQEVEAGRALMRDTKERGGRACHGSNKQPAWPSEELLLC